MIESRYIITADNDINGKNVTNKQLTKRDNMTIQKEYPTPDLIITMIEGLFEEMGLDIESWGDRKIIAEIIGEEARGKGYTAEYLQKFIVGDREPPALFVRTLESLLAQADGLPAEIVKAVPVEVFTTGNVRPGTLIKGDSVKCAYPPCGVWFIPRDRRHRFHHPNCYKLNRKHNKNGAGQ